MAGLALLGALLSFGDEYASTWVGERFTLALRAKVFRHLQRLEPDALDRRRHGDVLQRLTGDLHAIETLLLNALAEAVQATARLLFFAGALFLLSWKLALASLVVIPPLYWAAKNFGRLARRAARERRRRSGSVGAVLEEALANTALVQTANAQSREQERLRRENEGAVAAELAGTRVAGLFAPVIDLIELAGALLIIAPRHVGAELRRADARWPAGVPRLPVAALPAAARPLAPLPAGLRGHRGRRARDRAARHRAARAGAPAGARLARARGRLRTAQRLRVYPGAPPRWPA